MLSFFGPREVVQTLRRPRCWDRPSFPDRTLQSFPGALLGLPLPQAVPPQPLRTGPHTQARPSPLPLILRPDMTDDVMVVNTRGLRGISVYLFCFAVLIRMSQITRALTPSGDKSCCSANSLEDLSVIHVITVTTYGSVGSKIENSTYRLCSAEEKKHIAVIFSVWIKPKKRESFFHFWFCIPLLWHPSRDLLFCCDVLCQACSTCLFWETSESVDLFASNAKCDCWLENSDVPHIVELSRRV